LIRPVAEEAMFLRESQRMIALAVAGQKRALQRVAHEIYPSLVGRHRMAPALAIQAHASWISGPSVDKWRRGLLLSMARWLCLREEIKRVGETLGREGVTWIPLKGNDLATRVYDHPEERPVSDLDILIAGSDYFKARAALEAEGWAGLYPGTRFDRFILEEWHHWVARNQRGFVLELHIRLWNLVPPGLEAELIEKAGPDPTLGPGGRRIRLSHAFVVAGVQAQINHTPRPLLSWWDLVRIAQRTGKTLAPEVVELARRWEVQLPVSLAAATAAELWQNDACREIASDLAHDMRLPELVAQRRALQGGIDALSRRDLALARLLSFRGRRGGLGGLRRMVWPHPGVVERDTPWNWPWAKRRIFHTLWKLGLAKPGRFTPPGGQVPARPGPMD